MKVVYNACFGGFSLSEEAVDLLEERAPHLVEKYSGGRYVRNDIPRNHPALVSVVEELGSKSSGQFSNLKITEVPDGIEFGIFDYDGAETIYEIGHAWGCQV